MPLLSLLGFVGEAEAEVEVATVAVAVAANLYCLIHSFIPLSFIHSFTHSSRCIAWGGGGCKRAVAWTAFWWLHGYGDGTVDWMDRADTQTYIRHNDVHFSGQLIQ